MVSVRDALRSQRSRIENHWDELSRFFMPFRLTLTDGMPDIPSAEEIHDSSPRRAALILANGLASLVTPREEVWFEYQAPRELRGDDEAVRFYRLASETAREYIEASNFYEEIQECYISSPVFGTSALFCGDLDERGELYFRNQPIKTYFIAEDAKGRVTSFFRDLQLTAEQAADEFGKASLPEEVARKVGRPEGATETHDFVHGVYRRTEKVSDDAPEGARKPWHSRVIHEKTKVIVQDSGFDEFPFAVHRYRRFGTCPWGFGPGAIALSDARQLSFLNELADVATEKSVFPPVVAPSSLEGEIGQGALEITYVDPTDPNSAAMLREWATAGRYDVAKDRMQDKRQQVEEAFHVDLFQLFASRAKERAPMTATEAQLVAGEKLTQFSPVFGRLVSEKLDPILTRVFGVLLRAGLFGPPPVSVMRQLGGNRSGVARPAVLYKNRIMLAMQARQNGSLMDFMGLAAPMLQVYPEAVDVLDMGTIVRDSARNAGLPENWLRSKKDAEAISAARKAAAARAQQLAEADAAAGVAQKIGSTPPEMRESIASNLPPA